MQCNAIACNLQKKQAWTTMQVHLITEEYKRKMKPAGVDGEYVIWGDLDTIWVKDFNSCTLAKPTILSVSG